jgi:hypothetical protein
MLFAPATIVTIGATDTFQGFELKQIKSVAIAEADWVEQAEQAAREASVAAPIALGTQVKAALIAEGKTEAEATAEATALLNSLDDLDQNQTWDLLLKYGEAFKAILNIKQGQKLHVTVAKYFIGRRITSAWIEANRGELDALGIKSPIGVAVPNQAVDTRWLDELMPYLPVESLLAVYEFYCAERDAWVLKKYPNQSTTDQSTSDQSTQDQAQTEKTSETAAETASEPQTLGEGSPRSSGGGQRTGQRSTTK